jgi:hypothetical protein
VQPPEHEGNDEQQQQDDGHQAADEDGSWAPFCLGHRLLAPGLQLWQKIRVSMAGSFPPHWKGGHGGTVPKAAHPSC